MALSFEGGAVLDSKGIEDYETKRRRNPHYLWASDEVFLIASNRVCKRHATGPYAPSMSRADTRLDVRVQALLCPNEAIRKSNILRGKDAPTFS